MDGHRLAHQPALDGLRGLAVLGVLAFHAGHLRGGFLGVDAFFTLSGFLITGLLLAEHTATGRLSLGAFWARRARRLLPALCLVVAVVAASSVWWASAADRPGLRADGLAGLLYVANWHAVADGYWGAFASPSPFEHLWSLSIEEQLYVAWPLVVLVLLRRAPRLLLATTLGLALASSAWLAWMAGADLERTYLGTDTRASSLLVGAALAVAVRHRSPAPVPSGPRTVADRVADAAGLTVVAGLAWAWATVDGTDSRAYQGGLLAHALAVAAVILLVTRRPAGRVARALSWRPLTAVGLVSYGLYLWHWPVYVVLDPSRTGLDGWDLTAVRVAVTAVLSVASYLLVEQPVRRATWTVPRTGAVAAGAAAVLLPLVLVVTRLPSAPEVASLPTATTASPAPTTDPAPTTTPAGTPLRADAVDPPPPAATVLKTTPPLDALPRLPVPSADDPLRVLAFGDSYLYDASPGIAAALEATGAVTVAEEGLVGFSITRPGWQPVVAERVEHVEPDLVVAMWARFDAAWMADHGAAAYGALLEEAVELLTANGAVLAMVGLAPSATSGLDPRPVDRAINEVFAGLPDRFPGRVVYVDPDPVVAPDGVPSLTIPGPAGPLRVRKADLGHYCPDGAARFGAAAASLVAAIAGVPPADEAAWALGPWRADPRYDQPAGACR